MRSLPLPLVLALTLTLASSSAGCAVSFDEVRVNAPKPSAGSVAATPPVTLTARCRELGEREAFWSSVATGAALGAGAGGASVIPTPEKYRAIPVSISVGSAVLAAFSKLYAHKLGEAWAAECTTAQAKVNRDDDEETAEEKASGIDSCTRASTRLATLKCPEARPDFADVCRNALANKVPICPSKLAKIKTCAEVKDICR